MDIEDYLLLYPEEKSSVVGVGSSPIMPGCVAIKVGVLQFTEDSAACWGGPFAGGYATYSIQDWTNATDGNGINILEKYEEAYVKKLEKASRTNYNESPFLHRKYNIDSLRYTPSKEYPIKLWMLGNDDTSYAKFYRTIQEALTEIELFESNQPLDFHEVIDGFKFVFTN
jgi:hypothetical protein